VQDYYLGRQASEDHVWGRRSERGGRGSGTGGKGGGEGDEMAVRPCAVGTMGSAAPPFPLPPGSVGDGGGFQGIF